jgi:hypothetical protein
MFNTFPISVTRDFSTFSEISLIGKTVHQWGKMVRTHCALDSILKEMLRLDKTKGIEWITRKVSTLKFCVELGITS